MEVVVTTGAMRQVTTKAAAKCQPTPSIIKQRTGFPLFFNIDFPWLFHDQKMKIHDLSAPHIFPSSECIPELVVTVPSALSTIVKKIKRFIIWLYKWSCVTFTELLSTVVKIPWHYHFPWLSMTFAIFHDFPGLEKGLPKFRDFPWAGGTLKKSQRLLSSDFTFNQQIASSASTFCCTTVTSSM